MALTMLIKFIKQILKSLWVKQMVTPPVDGHYKRKKAPYTICSHIVSNGLSRVRRLPSGIAVELTDQYIGYYLPQSRST